MHAKNVYLRGWLPWLGICLLTATAQSAPLQRAEITRLLNEVLVLKPGEKPQPAKVAEVVTGETAVRTGTKSRAELEFSDKTLTRLGANSLFSFTQGTRDMSLEEGTMLLQVPKDAGGAKIRTAAVTAAITGTTVMVEHSAGNHSKLIVLEGTMRVYLPNKVGESILLKPGQMLILPPNATKLPNPVKVDLKKLVRTSKLLNTKDFEEIPSEELIKDEVATQQDELKDGKLVNTNVVLLGRGTEVIIATDDMLEAIENANDASTLIVDTDSSKPNPGPTPNPPPPPPPASKYQPITTIPGTPYVINSSTEVITDPTIKTDGKTDNGTLYNHKVQGKASNFFFGGSTQFEHYTGFNQDLADAGDVGVFEFQALEFRGSPNFITKNGPTNVAFVSRGDITSSGNGFTLDFSQLDEMYLITHGGSIILGNGIREIVGPSTLLELYARGAGGKIILDTPVSVNNGFVRLYAENSVTVNSTVKAKGIDIITGNSLFLSGLLKAPFIEIAARENVTLNAGNLDLNELQQLYVKARSLNLDGAFLLSSSPIELGNKDGGSVAAVGDLKGALFEVGSGGVTGGTNLTLHGSVNVLSQGPIDFSAPGTVIHVDGVIYSDNSIKFWGDSVVGSAEAKDFIRIDGTEEGVSLISKNGGILTKALDNTSTGLAYVSSPSVIEYTKLEGTFELDAPRIIRHGNGVSSSLPYFGNSVEVLDLDGKLTFDSSFYEPNLTVRLRPGFDVDNSAFGGITVGRLITNGPGGNVSLTVGLTANQVLLDGNLKMQGGNLDTGSLRVGGNFGFDSTVDVHNSFTIEGRIVDNDPIPGVRTLNLGSNVTNPVGAGGVDFQPGPAAVHQDGGNFDIFAGEGFTLGQGGIGGPASSSPQINLRGQDSTGPSNSGGTLNVVVSSSASRPLMVNSAYISTETGTAGAANGRSGDINLVHNATSDSGPGRIQLINSKLVTNRPGAREITGSTGTVGNIKLQSLAETGKGIRVANSSQLLAITNGSMPSGGNIDMITNGAAIQIANSYVEGKNITIDTQNAGLNGIVDIDNATMTASDVLKIRAYGNGGQLTISNNSVLSAGSQMKLYGGFTNGRVFFTGGGNINVNAPNVHIAGNVVEVRSDTNVNSNGNVNVYANGAGNHKYNTGGYGNINASGSLIKNNSTTGAPGF